MAYIRCAGSSGGSIQKKTATGAVATFNTGLPAPLIDVTSAIGYRSNGYTSASAINSKTTPVFDLAPYLTRANANTGNLALEKLVGLTVCFNQLIDLRSSYSDVTISQDNTSGIISLSGTASGRVSLCQNIQFISGHKYLMLFDLLTNPNNVTFTLGVGSGVPWISNITDTGAYNQMFENSYLTDFSIYYVDNVDLSGITFRFMVFDLTAMFGSEVADYLYNLENG